MTLEISLETPLSRFQCELELELFAPNRNVSLGSFSKLKFPKTASDELVNWLNPRGLVDLWLWKDAWFLTFKNRVEAELVAAPGFLAAVNGGELNPRMGFASLKLENPLFEFDDEEFMLF